jgi:hypothetical protein
MGGDLRELGLRGATILEYSDFYLSNESGTMVNFCEMLNVFPQEGLLRKIKLDT